MLFFLTLLACDNKTPQKPVQGSARPQNLSSLEISSPELKAVLEAGRPIRLLDVREPHEWQIARIDSAELTPLSAFESFISQLRPEEEIYLYCHHGVRSLAALQKLKARGFIQLRSLAGGIDAWSREVDPSIPRY